MLFKKILNFFVIMMLVNACHSERHQRHQTAIQEIMTTEEVKAEDQLRENSFIKFDSNYLSINALIEEGSDDSLLLALKQVDDILYSEENKLKENYTHISYVSKLNLLVKLFKIYEGSSGVPKFRKEFLLSLNKFNEHFVLPCVDANQNQCEFLQQSLKQEASLVSVVVYMAKNEPKNDKKIKLLELAYDLQGRRNEVSLNNLYLVTIFEVLSSISDENVSSEEVERLSRHKFNASALILINNWNEISTQQKEQFQIIKPWLFSKKESSHINELRGQVVKFLPMYVDASEEIRSAVKQITSERIREITNSTTDLKDYPAFSDINLDSFKSDNVLAPYIIVSLYFQYLSLDDSNSLFSNATDQSILYDASFKLSKLLVRWDVAQLSIKTTKKLSQKFAEQDVKTKVFVQENLDWSKNLIPLWTEFHSTRLLSVKSFMETNIRASEKLTHNSIQAFYSAINRNILKTTVYPNMLAYSYFMAKSEWRSIVRILWFTFDLDTTILLDQLLTGQLRSPWFNFVNMSEVSGVEVDERTALYRSELLDSIHYLFTTNTFKAYDIEPNDFFKVASDTILKKRRTIFEKTMDIQKELYFSDSGVPANFVRWCEGIKENKPIKETVSFYHLSMFNNPTNINAGFQDNNGNQSFYFEDVYKAFDYKISRLPVINDRFRMEYLPILATLNKYYSIAQRVSVKNPNLQMGNMSDFKKYVDDAKLFASAFWGYQQSIANMIGDCLFVGYDESMRRAQDSTYAHYQYFKEIVHPLLKKVTQSEISLDQANQIIQDFHNNQKGIFDEIVTTNSGRAKYITSQNAYMLRTRMFFISGKKIDVDGIGHLDIRPIVGSHMDIPVPSNQDTDVENNPYTSKGNAAENIREIYFEDDAEVFSNSAIAAVADELRTSIDSTGFTEWDQHDVSKFSAYSQYHVEFYIQKLLIKDLKYINFLDSDCMNYKEGLKDKCFKEDKSNYDGLTKLMGNIYNFYSLNEKDRDYLGRIKEVGFADRKAMQTTLKFDITAPEDFMTKSLPYDGLAGIFDFAYEMLRSDYLGLSFESEWDVYQASTTGMADKTDLSCEGQRDGCPWKNEKVIAKNFFTAREKRPGFIFKFDKEILQEDFEDVKNKVLTKFKTVLDLEEQGQELIEKNIENYADPLYYHMHKPPAKLYPLKRNFQNYESIYKDFFIEETEGFFLKEAHWDKLFVD